jgi:hypothetical protein
VPQLWSRSRCVAGVLAAGLGERFEDRADVAGEELAVGGQRIAGARSPRDRDTDHGRDLEGANVRSVAPRSDAVDRDQLGK